MRRRQQGDGEFIPSIHFLSVHTARVNSVDSPVNLAASMNCLNELFEDGLRKLIFLPPDLGVPLHAERETIRARVDDRFNNPIRRARNHLQIAPDFIYGLVMRAVDARGLA